ELVSAADRSIAAMLGASPGASTAVAIMLEVLERCFPEQLHAGGWLTKLKKMIPSYGESLIENAALCARVRSYTAEILHINDVTTGNAQGWECPVAPALTSRLTGLCGGSGHHDPGP